MKTTVLLLSISVFFVDGYLINAGDYYNDRYYNQPFQGYGIKQNSYPNYLDAEKYENYRFDNDRNDVLKSQQYYDYFKESPRNQDPNSKRKSAQDEPKSAGEFSPEIWDISEEQKVPTNRDQKSLEESSLEVWRTSEESQGPTSDEKVEEEQESPEEYSLETEDASHGNLNSARGENAARKKKEPTQESSLEILDAPQESKEHVVINPFSFMKGFPGQVDPSLKEDNEHTSRKPLKTLRQ